MRYGERTYLYYSDSAADGATQINDAWSDFVAVHSANIERMHDALTSEYKPLENYSMKERSERVDDLTDTTERNEVVTAENSTTSNGNNQTTSTTTNSGTITDTANNSTVNKVAAYDGADMTDHDSATTTANNTRTDSTSQSYNDTAEATASTSLNGTSTTETNDITTHGGTVVNDITRTGNIGVTTSQQMLTSEIYLRTRNSLAYYVVELFVSQYTTWG